MKIALINSTFAPDVIGGAELSVQYLAEGLVEAGHDVVVVAMGRESRIECHGRVRIYRVKLKNLYWPYDGRRAMPLRVAWNALDIANPFMAREIGAILVREKPDIVHTNNLQGISPLVWKASYELRIPVVHTIRDLYLLCPKSAMFRKGRNCDRQCFSCSLFSRAKRGLSRYVDRVVGISKYILDKHCTLGWFPNASQAVIHNSYPLPLEPTANHRGDKVRFGYLGRLDQRKGVELLLSAFRRSRLTDRSTLLLGGTGERSYVELLQSKAAGLPVTFAGRIAPQDLFSQIDVLVVPSIIHEALGRVIIEAYAYECPVIGSLRGGIPEIVENGKTGFLFDPDSSDALAILLERFASDPELARDMGRAGRIQFDKFQPHIIADQYEDVYSSIVHQGLPQMRTGNSTQIARRT